MKKQEALVNLSAIFNRGSSDDEATSKYFIGKLHDDLLNLLMDYIQKSEKLIGNPKIYKTQALNDRGVDLIIEFANGIKIGIQVKSPHDVTEENFSQKVKAQMAESRAHGLHKWFLLICSPLKVKSKGKKDSDYTFKIGHLINELSSYKTSYHALYTPQQCHSILTKGIMTLDEFQGIKNQFILEPVDWDSIMVEMKHDKSLDGYLSRVETVKSDKVTSLKEYLKYTNVGEEGESYLLETINHLLGKLKKLSRKDKRISFVTLTKSYKVPGSITRVFGANCKDLENSLGISGMAIKNEVSILADLGIAELNNENESNIWYVQILPLSRDYHVLEDLKEFCEKKGRSLKDIIVNLDFNELD